MNENRKTEFLTNIRQIMRLHDKMLKSICGQYQMNITETAVISFLYNNPGKDTAADIVELRMLSKGAVSQAVESLIQKKLLEREQDTKDRRRIHLSLTPAANPITQEIEKAQKGFRDKVFQGFTEEERELFNEFHLRIQENTKQALEGGDIQ
ncbi:MAG TPA: MarR family transcriptional regulator [Candidatus Merdivicinus excrementipullorum]|uniref:MarR family transcriptional regulator n=1 Tax=Candidatus Merdivicinus excrementipullorum TaxID=2840867 RepID=A0A9D1K0F0_9FIRM|nr:MarR family transcriptional regulator [Candidatus Merdivicinus excrementipullorum]HIV17870.1 MarR family transcriptional regulator [Candidatus Merdivicinus intestinigallinarum]